MGPVSATTPIDVPRERAFELLADLANRPGLLAGFGDEFRLQRLDSTGVGAAARFRIPGRGLWLETTIAELEPPHRIVERGRGSRLDRMPVSTVWELEDGPGGDSCEVTVTFWTEPSALGDHIREKRPGTRRFYRRGWEGVLRRLRDTLESERQLERVVVAGGDRIPGAG
jgi:uncharacterized protein YndB with AHSA1/START domain